MTKRLKITVQGKTYSVQVDDLRGSPVTVWVDDEPISVEWEAETPDLGRVATPAPRVEPTRESTVIEPGSRPVVAGRGVITAPMPGKITSIRVKVGDRVKARDVVCTLEAMKMEQSIRSTQEGTVAAIPIHEGQTVAHGAILVELA